MVMFDEAGADITLKSRNKRVLLLNNFMFSYDLALQTLCCSCLQEKAVRRNLVTFL